MSTSKEYKAVRNCILNELHLTKEDIIKNIEPLLEKLVKQCMLNTYGGNNQIEHWIRCMVADELKQRDYGFVERISKEIIKDHVLNELNIIVSPKNERCVCENRVPSRKDGLYLIYGNGHAEPFTGDNSKDCVQYIGLKHRYMSFAISLTEHDIVQLLDDDSREESGSGTYYECESKHSLMFRHLPSPRRGIGPALRAARPSRGTWSSPVASRAPATSTSETWFGR